MVNQTVTHLFAWGKLLNQKLQNTKWINGKIIISPIFQCKTQVAILIALLMTLVFWCCDSSLFTAQTAIIAPINGSYHEIVMLLLWCQ